MVINPTYVDTIEGVRFSAYRPKVHDHGATTIRLRASKGTLDDTYDLCFRRGQATYVVHAYTGHYGNVQGGSGKVQDRVLRQRLINLAHRAGVPRTA